jgi:caffeoyl-CoA O-methyltransferase
MKFIDPALEEYAQQFTDPEPSYLKELAEETRANIELPQMLSGHLQGRFLSLMSRMLAPKVVIDIGTYTGYSAMCMAEGLADDGIVHTIDINMELAPMVDRYLRKADMHGKVYQHLAPALEVIPHIEGEIDLVFIDADKGNYSNYFDLVIERVRPGGLIIADNVLWSGRVLDASQDEETHALAAYVRKVSADERTENLLMPLRDGLLISRKKIRQAS